MLVHPVRETSITIKQSPAIDQTLLQKFQRIAIHRLIRKLDYRLLPYLWLIEIASYVNRISTGRNVPLAFSIPNNYHSGHATLMDIEHDLHLELNEIEWSVSLFFLAYVNKEYF